MPVVSKLKRYINLLFFLCIYLLQPELVSAHFESKKFIQKCTKEITEFLRRYHRPITILFDGDIANKLGSHIAKNFKNATCVLINSDSRSLLSRCREEDLKNLIFIQKYVDAEKLQRLSECEHFDVTIEMNSRDFENDWNNRKKAFLQMGDFAFSLISKKRKKGLKALTEYSRCINEKVLCKQENMLFVRYQTCNEYLLRKNFDRDFFAMKNKYLIESNFNEKILSKRRDGEILVSSWVHGINLNTFANLGGGFPDKKRVISSVLKLKQIQHNDISMHNMVIQGKKVAFIDFSPVSGILKKSAAQKFNIIIRNLRNMLVV